MISRREWLGRSVGVGAMLALPPELLRTLQAPRQPGRELIQRAIPSSGEVLPIIGFAPRPPVDPAAMKAILEALADNGGKVVDGSAPLGERAARTAAEELGIQNKFFWTTPSVSVPRAGGPFLPGVVPKADPAVIRAGLEEKLAKLEVPKVDLVMVSTLADARTHLAVLKEMKKEGRVRYVGVNHLAMPAGSPAPFGSLESIMHDEPIDFVATDYSVTDRRAEETVLPLAQQRKIAFIATYPFYRAKGLQRASATPLPEWAAEFDAKTWAQFFLKYIASHPAVTVVRTGTTKAAHMLDNLGGGIGRLPDEAMRKRMAQLVDALPPAPATPPPPGMTTEEQVRELQAKQRPAVALSAAVLDRYVGEYEHAPVGTIVTVRRDGDRLLVKVHGATPNENPFVALSETRFASAPTFTLEFHLDGHGKATGATWMQFSDRIPLQRK